MREREREKIGLRGYSNPCRMQINSWADEKEDQLEKGARKQRK